MHKIKELLHKDSEDKDVKHEHGHDHKHEHGHTTTGHTTTTTGHTHAHDATHTHVVQPGTVGGTTTTTTTREVIHEHGKDHDHGHVHKTESHHAHSSGEKHIYHEREVVKDGGDLYRGGEDPTLHREVATETRHDAGVTRSVVGEAQVVKEKIKEVELHKVQPVIHRDREQKEIRHIVEPHQESEVKATKIEHREKDIDLGTRREESTLATSRAVGSAPQIESTREFLGTERQHQELAAKVEEHVHKKVEEHIHPVIYKETLVPKVTEEVHHVYETVKERPVETYEVKDVQIHGGATRDAERAFFSEHATRGIEVGDASRSVHHSTHTHEHGHHTHGHTHTHGSTERVVETTTTHTTSGGHIVPEPIIGHHQNIGAHHVAAGAVPVGHNTAYDAALLHQDPAKTSVAPVHSHKDAELVHKMDEKKAEKAEKLEDKKH